MEISFIRGDNHQERFRFKDFTGTVDDLFFTVKCKNRYIRIKKRLNDGINLNDDSWYYINFEPADTDNLPCDIEMEYDIQIITSGEKYTVQKGAFVLEEDITTPDCEV